jgi:hypothetical protein
MKILSYKILSEAKEVLGVGGFNSSTRRGKGLAGGIKTAQGYGLDSSEATDFYFKETVDMNFTIYNTQTQQPLGRYNVLFLQKVEDNGLELYLHPYDKYKSTALAPNNAKKWGSLKLYDGNGSQVDLTNLNDLKFDENSLNTYNFLFKIGDADYFKKINNLYKYTDLNRLLSFNNTTGTYNNDYYIKFSSVVEGKVPSYYGNGRMNNLNNEYDIQIEFKNTNNQQVTIPFFGNPQTAQRYTIAFNPQSPPLVNPPPQLTNIISLKNSQGEIAYMYTQQPIIRYTNQTNARQCYLYIPQTQGGISGNYNFNIMRMKRA